MPSKRSFSSKSAVVLLSAVLCTRSHATWSICITDSRTQEVAVGTVTCLCTTVAPDLLALVPVLVVGKGAGAVQSAGDFNCARRPIIFDGFQNGTDPVQILATLAATQSGHQTRQYGIVDTIGRAISFTGSSNGTWAGGVTGTQGTMTYAIQGNVLTGSCVVPAIEQAILNTSGDIPAKFMAGMQAARSQGGDGRCSCNSALPESCGCPPPAFTRVGFIGGMIVARIGDTDDACENVIPPPPSPQQCADLDGCTNGDYFMRLNVVSTGCELPADPDPVTELQLLFDSWRSGLTGRPDAVQSVAQVTPGTLLPYQPPTMATLSISLLDWDGDPITAPINSVVVVHASGSSGISSIGPVVDQGGGQYSVTLGAGSAFGLDRFRITVDDGIRPVILMPDPSLAYPAPNIPAITAQGWVLLAVSLIAGGSVAFARRPRRDVGTR